MSDFAPQPDPLLPPAPTPETPPPVPGRDQPTPEPMPAVLTFVPTKTLWSSLREQFREKFHPEKLPPLELQSQPVPVDDIWSHKKRFLGGGMSLLVHAIILALLLLPLFNPAVHQAVLGNLGNATVLHFPVLAPASPKPLGGGGGGGLHVLRTPSRGKLPVFRRHPLAPPMVKVQFKPLLPVQPALAVEKRISLPQPNLPQFGDPVAVAAPPTNGPGSMEGAGVGASGGVGPGNGAGYGPGSGGNLGGGMASVGADVSSPVVVYDPDPQFTDAARKARYYGTVVLEVDIGTDGRAHNIRVIQPLGLGLDQKAIDAVRLWRFIPAKRRNGQPVEVAADIQVHFRLF
ncbi:MAG: energy transducer TonB [Terriglobales bacterium]